MHRTWILWAMPFKHSRRWRYPQSCREDTEGNRYLHLSWFDKMKGDDFRNYQRQRGNWRILLCYTRRWSMPSTNRMMITPYLQDIVWRATDGSRMLLKPTQHSFEWMHETPAISCVRKPTFRRPHICTVDNIFHSFVAINVCYNARQLWHLTTDIS